MVYSCKKCRRPFECPEAISYCPFCGTAYDGAVSAATRIVIGSDSERTVQERYWRQTDLEIQRMMRLLKEEIPDPDDMEKQSIDLQEWSRVQEKCTSVVQFEQRFQALLSQIGERMQAKSLPAHPASIPMEAFAERFDVLGQRISQTLGETAALERPTLRYEPVEVGLRSAAERDGWATLWGTIQGVWPKVRVLIREHGPFVIQSALKRLPYGSKKEVDSEKLSRRIQKLAQKEYDPLFGEECDDFADAYCMGVLALTRFANQRNALCEYDEDERAKIDALNAYADDWAHALRSALDRAYQAQQLDMLGTYESVRRICAETEEEYKARNREEEE